MNKLPTDLYDKINNFLFFTEMLQLTSINKFILNSRIRINLLIRSCIQMSYACGIHDGYIHGTNISRFNFSLNKSIFNSLKCKKPKKDNIEYQSWRMMQKISNKLFKHLKNKF
jgi:hypothetical protein